LSLEANGDSAADEGALMCDAFTKSCRAQSDALSASDSSSARWRASMAAAATGGESEFDTNEETTKK
jgi:hypothetical protein